GQMGLRIPEDVSIIGTGDSDRDGAIIRRLASITVDEAAIGHRAVEVLQQMKNDDRPLHGEERIVMPLNFVEGETLGPVPERKSLNVDFS
ncbi:MAG: substrate-binding domain-containing protein, partial [Planctomycetota bacterium]|nr:substrate-binding domain-containing protein [Planctomycetota bacterium]